MKVNTYKLVWNTKKDEGTFLIDSEEGVEQVLVDSAAEASLLLTKLRNDKDMFLEKGLLYSEDTPVSVGNTATPAVSKKAITKKKKTTKKKKKATKSAKDNLKLIEGIGQKIEGLLNDAGIITFEELTATKVDFLKAILEDAGSRYKMHDPSTWAEQAGLAHKEEWDALEKLQEELKGGRKV